MTPADNNRPPQYAPRRQSHAVCIGNVVIGGGAPVVVQSMTDTDTADDLATAIQCADLVRAGAEMVRITVNTPKAAAAVESVRKRLDDMDINAPLIGDFHYNGHKLLAQYPDCARALAKYRINPGNIGKGDKHDAQFRAIVDIALHNDKPLRIGVNWGSVDPDLLAAMMDENARAKPPQDSQIVLRSALVESALLSARAAQQWGMPPERIVISCKTSRIPDLLAVYRRLAKECRYPLHLGLTEAGGGLGGTASSSAAMAILLAEGIGDTIRASLTPAPGAARSEEAKLCCVLLQSLGLRAFAPRVAACPGCGRTGSDFFRRLAGTIEEHIARQLPKWKREYPGVENLNIAVMGCIVNGPGESQHADIGISLPGSGESPVAPVFIDGKKTTALKGENIAADFINILEQYIRNKYARAEGGGEKFG
ncbi:MAG: flavodoxin-dependent (E)-4-hydroxy-3-methylbut-2-enyl-diphosphate synthase [Gammaproteobacteria bacterium]